MPHAYKVEYLDPTIDLTVLYLRNSEVEISQEEARDIRAQIAAHIEGGQPIVTGRDWEMAGAMRTATVHHVDDVVLDGDGITLLDDDGKTIAAFTTGVSAQRIVS
jgi:hypothetical protein